MTATNEELRLAIVQPPMKWKTDENVELILDVLALAAAQGAAVCALPELALTGFHRGIREEAVPATVDAAMARVQTACRQHGIACTIGMPTFADDGAILDSYVFVAADGEIALTVSKNGLTPAEQTFFRAGTERPIAPFAGRSCSTVMCREIDDLEAIALQWQAEAPDLVFWPSLVGHPPGTILPDGADSSDLGYEIGTALLARRLGVHVVQSNWPMALNTPESTWLGESKVYAPDGEMLLKLPRDEAGIAVFTLGERSYAWTPLRG
ncbi:MAG: hypothetical protein JSR59_03805 [Proteobacteria bacterium]|nr:hypothetical protein [Pseudomonadota bacterium]